MKKHPVDDLFRKRLTSLEKNPSEQAWKRIQEGQKTKSRRMAAWVWYAAASVVLTLIAGYSVWQGQHNISSGEPMNMAGVENRIPEKTLSTESVSGATESKADGRLQVLVPAENSSIAKQEIPKSIPEKSTHAGLPVEKHKAEQNPYIRIAKMQPLKTEDLKVEKPEIEQAVSVESTQKPVELAQREEKQPDRTIIVEVEEPAHEKSEKSRSRLSRVFRQLKNVREAEPVDWDDVGFNPKSIMARADDRTNDDGKVSGKRERKN